MKPSPREIELKLEAAPDDLDRLLAHPLVTEAEPSAVKTEDLRSTYFDTSDHRLRQAGLSLRIRTNGDKRIQTLKSAGSGGVMLDRGEWEQEVADGLDLGPLRATPLGTLLADGDLRGRIGPAFTVEVRRTSVMIHHQGAEVELAVDRGDILAGEARSPLGEVELELKRGDPAALFDLALRLGEVAPLRLSFRPKSERGYALSIGTVAPVVKADPVHLESGMTAAAAFRAIASNCLRHLMANERVLRDRRDAGAVHQMRVALRRLRAAVTLFRRVVADERQDAVKGELRWMANALGAARDLDVFIARSLDPLRERTEREPDLEVLIADFDRRRERAYDAALATVTSPRFMRSVLATAAWVEAGAWQENADPAAREARSREIRAFAAEELARRWRKVRRRGKHLERLDPEARHRLRIEIKKLRYATEFFGGLFDRKAQAKRRRAALSLLEKLQETLGELNDIAVGGAMMGSGDMPDERARLLTRLLGEEHRAGTRKLLKRAARSRDRWGELEPFWT